EAKDSEARKSRPSYPSTQNQLSRLTRPSVGFARSVTVGKAPSRSRPSWVATPCGSGSGCNGTGVGPEGGSQGAALRLARVSRKGGSTVDSNGNPPNVSGAMGA